MRDKARQLGRLVEIQRLVKFRHETRLTAAEVEIARLDEERNALLDLQDRHYETGGGFIPMNAIVTRVEAVLRRKEALDIEAEQARRELLRASRILDSVEDRHRTETRMNERREVAQSVEEALAHMIARSRSSLP